MRLLALVSVAFLSITSCKKKISSNDYGLNASETLRVVLATEPPTMDWSKSSDSTSSFILENIMEGLVTYDFSQPTVSLSPAIATEWSASNNSQSWEFTIRDDVKWSDGQRMTVQHILDGWERLLSPETASVYAYFLFCIKNAENYNNGTIKDFSKVGVKVVGQKIIVELNEPTNFPFLMTHHSTYPVRNDIIQKHGDRWTEASNIVTLGHYQLKVWDHDKALVLERNENFYGEKAKTKNIIAYIIEQDNTALNLFKSGKVDALIQVPSSMLRLLRALPEYKERTALISYYFGFNTKKPPVNDANLRRALISAVDRTQITEMLKGGQVPMSGWIPEGMFGHDKDAGLKYNPEKALEFYKLAGYSKENPAATISLAYNTNEDHQRIAENIQAQLKKNLNLTVEIKNEEWKVYLGTLRSDPPHMYRMGWVADYPDPNNFYELMTSVSANNYTGWKDKSFDESLKKAIKSSDEKVKLKYYNEAQNKLLNEAVAVFPIYTSASHHMVSQRIKNFPHNVMTRYSLKDVVINNQLEDGKSTQ